MAKSKKADPYLMSAMANIYVHGARVQLRRYNEAQSINNQFGTATYECIFEVSSLFEHMATLATYLNICDLKLPINEKIIDIRNHIRHDTRENIDQENTRKERRASRLGLDGGDMQVMIVVSGDGVEVGNVAMTSAEIKLFIDMADGAFKALSVGAKVAVDGSSIIVNPPVDSGSSE